MSIFAVSSLEGATAKLIKEEAKEAGAVEIVRKVDTPAEAVEALKEAVQLQINRMLTQPGALTLASPARFEKGAGAGRPDGEAVRGRPGRRRGPRPGNRGKTQGGHHGDLWCLTRSSIPTKNTGYQTNPGSRSACSHGRRAKRSARRTKSPRTVSSTTWTASVPGGSFFPAANARPGRRWKKASSATPRPWGSIVKAYERDYRTDEATYRALEIEYPNGSRITALPANPDTARGFSANVFLDEFAFHLDSRKIWTALFPVISAGWKLRVVSTPNGKGNKFLRPHDRRGHHLVSPDHGHLSGRGRRPAPQRPGAARRYRR